MDAVSMHVTTNTTDDDVDSVQLHLHHLDTVAMLEASSLIAFLNKNETLSMERSELAPSPGYMDFLSACLDHSKTLIHRIDMSYTDVRLREVLVNECKLTMEFPLVYDHGFKDADSCFKFADLLVEAREHEFRHNSTRKYGTFCRSYDRHLHPNISVRDEADNAALTADENEDVAEEVSKEVSSGMLWIWALIFFVVLLAAGGLYWTLSRKTGARGQRVGGGPQGLRAH